MDIVDLLKSQHAIFLGRLLSLEDLKNSGDYSGAELKKSVLDIAMEVKKHAEIEESILFPRLRPHLGEEMTPRRVMDFEHKEIYEILATMNQTEDERIIRVEAAKFISFLRDHISKEEMVLFPAALQYITKKELNEMGQLALARGSDA